MNGEKIKTCGCGYGRRSHDVVTLSQVSNSLPCRYPRTFTTAATPQVYYTARAQIIISLCSTIPGAYGAKAHRSVMHPS